MKTFAKNLPARLINGCLRPLGIQVVRRPKAVELSSELPSEYAEFREIYQRCREYSMTSTERLYSLYKAVEYIAVNRIAGDFVECGVWRGGSAMVMALTLQKFNDTGRHIFLYDTFEGMTTPSDLDVDARGTKAADRWRDRDGVDEQDGKWCYASLSEVQANMRKTQYDPALLHFIQGKVEETIPKSLPKDSLALLRLDTDWYESTRHEMSHLYPKLVRDGVFIVDDYGDWQGAKKAVDEYFADKRRPLLNRIDNTGRIAIKP